MSPFRRLTVTSRRTLFSFARKSLWQLPPDSGPPIPQQELVDEEVCPNYNSATFYPAKPGEVLAKKFQLLVKDHNQPYGSPETFQEHRGRVILRTCLADFEVTGPEGKHVCLVYEPMREPLWILQRRFVDRKLPLPIVKAYIYFLLAGLDHLHAECKVVHTDLKLGNILMSFENENVLTNFIKRQQPMQCKVDGERGRTIYRCHNDFGALDGREIKNMIPKIADFGLAIRLDKPSTRDGMVGEQLGICPIQPDHYRAPEVILGCGWDFKADIWNFGVLLWNILGSKELFQQVHDTNGQYDAKSHLAEMIALLGPPPRELLAKSKAMSEHNWPQPVTNDTGKLCKNAEEFFDGPFFNTEGEVADLDVFREIPKEINGTFYRIMVDLFVPPGAVKEVAIFYAGDPDTLDTIKYDAFGDQVKSNTFTAHHKVDPVTNELVVFGYEAKGLATLNIVTDALDAQGRNTEALWLESPGCDFIHGCAITINFIVLFIWPFETRMGRLKEGSHYWSWHYERPAFIVVPQRPGAPQSAWETEDGKIYEEGSRVHDNAFPFFPPKDGRMPSPNSKADFVRWEFDLSKPTSTTISHPTVVLDLPSEFPRIDESSYIGYTSSFEDEYL
ncbi:hypothetical protein CNMCM5623_009304 [Aspergillus felis]|uniref:non-specific serine/threonine protein kinase n=1 Tax=Aspergillus felis TaxID=1287682 RepID=A0A8H6Q376_9EURO|nr:hypothetical protein CNMCM5623_009304 [Aspergillus felis]